MRGRWHKAFAVEVGMIVTLAVGMVLLPLLRVAHLHLADHDHRYCPEHGTLEVVPRVAATSAPRSSHGSPGYSLAQRSDGSHQTCVLLGGTLSRELGLCEAAPPGRPCAFGPESGCVTLCAQEGRSTPARWMLLAAPKQSPPGIAS